VQVVVRVRRPVVQDERRAPGRTIGRQAPQVRPVLGPPRDAGRLAFGELGPHREVGLGQVQGRTIIARGRFGHRTLRIRARRCAPPPARLKFGDGRLRRGEECRGRRRLRRVAAVVHRDVMAVLERTDHAGLTPPERFRAKAGERLNLRPCRDVGKLCRIGMGGNNERIRRSPSIVARVLLVGTHRFRFVPHRRRGCAGERRDEVVGDKRARVDVAPPGRGRGRRARPRPRSARNDAAAFETRVATPRPECPRCAGSGCRRSLLRPALAEQERAEHRVPAVHHVVGRRDDEHAAATSSSAKAMPTRDAIRVATARSRRRCHSSARRMRPPSIG
jgi:hypothetical protein